MSAPELAVGDEGLRRRIEQIADLLLTTEFFPAGGSEVEECPHLLTADRGMTRSDDPRIVPNPEERYEKSFTMEYLELGSIEPQPPILRRPPESVHGQETLLGRKERLAE